MTPVVIFLAYLLVAVALLAPFAAAAAVTSAPYRDRVLHLRDGQFRAEPLTGQLHDDGRHAGPDADARRARHDLDAVRTRFEEHPVWPSPGVPGERR